MRLSLISSSSVVFYLNIIYIEHEIGVNEITIVSVNEITTLSVNEVTTIVKPTASSQSSNYICDQVSLLLSIGVGFLLFTNLITIIVFIISCIWLLRSKRRHEKL